MTGVLTRKKFGLRLGNTMYIQRHGRRRPRDNRGSDQSVAAISKGMPMIAGNLRKMEEARKSSLLQLSKGTWLGWHLALAFVASKTFKTNFCCFKPLNLWYFAIEFLKNNQGVFHKFLVTGRIRIKTNTSISQECFGEEPYRP